MTGRQHIVTTAVEHSAMREHCEELAKRGCEVTFLGVDGEGNLDLDEVEDAIRPDTAIVSVMWANNETGVLFPVEKSPGSRSRKARFFTPMRFRLSARCRSAGGFGDQLSFLSAHKLHGPKGVGALYVKGRMRFRPLLIGGSQENDAARGTENVASIVGLGKAAEPRLKRWRKSKPACAHAGPF